MVSFCHSKFREYKKEVTENRPLQNPAIDGFRVRDGIINNYNFKLIRNIALTPIKNSSMKTVIF